MEFLEAETVFSECFLLDSAMLQFHEKHFSGPKLKEFFDKKGSWSYLAELYFRKAIEENKIKDWATSNFFLYNLQHNVM